MSEAKRIRKPDTRKGDRHRPGYWTEYGRLRRAKDKALSIPKPNLPTPTKQEENNDD